MASIFCLTTTSTIPLLLTLSSSPSLSPSPLTTISSRPHTLTKRRRGFDRFDPFPLSITSTTAFSFSSNGISTSNSVPARNNTYTVGDFMTTKEFLQVVKSSTSVDDALEILVEQRVTGLPVIDDDWTLVGVISDYDLLALDSISGGGQCDTNLFPNVDSSWKTFNEIQKLLMKTYGKTVGDLMTPSPLVVRENTNLEDAARFLLETKYHRLPVVDAQGKLIGIITRGDIVRAALQIKRASETSS